jgi:hypothetical protein
MNATWQPSSAHALRRLTRRGGQRSQRHFTWPDNAVAHDLGTTASGVCH